MNEYYNTRYNLYKYFINVDSDEYHLNLLSIIYLITFVSYLITFILSVFAIILVLNFNGYTILYIILLICYYFITYNLITSIKSIETNETLIKYGKFYEFTNIIFKENLEYALNKYNDNPNVLYNADVKYLYSIKETILLNINNIENLYGEDADKLYNSSDDRLKYFDLDEYISKGFYNKLYIDKNNFIDKNLPYIIKEDKDIKYINFEILERYDKQKSQLINHLNIKYNKKLSFWSKHIFTPNFYKNLNTLIANYKKNIYYYIFISMIFIIILLHSLFVYFNYVLTYIYLAIIGIALIILYYN
jgi:hypothetical protein